MLLKETIEKIAPVNEAYRDLCEKHWDSLCKPLDGFGKLEDLVSQIGAVQETDRPKLNKRAIVIMGADNGVVAEGVSQTGSEVTLQVLENMGDYKSSVCVMSRILNAEVIPVNIGMNQNASHPRVKNLAVRFGTGNIAQGPAMTREEAIRAIETGIRVVEELKEDGYDLIVTGEMGIGNTTTSAACASVLFQKDPALVTGKGAGLTSEGLVRKTKVVERAIAVNRPDPKDPLDVIAKVGGLDIAGMTGCFLGAAANHIPVLIDGVISGISACLAAMLCPDSVQYMIATHSTAEPAGVCLMEYLQLEPILNAGMHLGEGTGAAAFMPLLDQALNVYYNLPSFSEGNVEQYEHLK